MAGIPCHARRGLTVQTQPFGRTQLTVTMYVVFVSPEGRFRVTLRGETPKISPKSRSGHSDVSGRSSGVDPSVPTDIFDLG
jgi:hypothetical protein